MSHLQFKCEEEKKAIKRKNEGNRRPSRLIFTFFFKLSIANSLDLPLFLLWYVYQTNKLKFVNVKEDVTSASFCCNLIWLGPMVKDKMQSSFSFRTEKFYLKRKMFKSSFLISWLLMLSFDKITYTSTKTNRQIPKLGKNIQHPRNNLYLLPVFSCCVIVV